MTFRNLIIITLSFLTFACQENKNTSDFTIVKFQTEWDWIFKNAEPTKLSDVELANIEKLLLNAVTDYNFSQTENIKERKEWFEKTYPNKDFNKSEPKLEIFLANYKKQYVPVINSNGEKEVWANLFCSTLHTEWRSEIVKVYDGGNCYFNLKINLTKNNYSDFLVNGGF